jgi:RND superfamily putative drug exporter
MAARHRREQARIVNSNAIQGDEMNLAGRAGRWSAAHWKTATLGWLAFAVAAVMLGSMHGTVKQTSAEQTNGQAARAERMLTAAHVKSHASEYVLVHSQTLTARSSAFRRTVNDVRTKLEETANTGNVRLGPMSKDGHFELVEFDVTGDADTADSRIQPALTAVATLASTHPGYTISEVGDASISKAMNTVISDGISKAEKLSLPITFTILLLAFGAFLAAGIPVLLAFTAVLAAIGLTHLGSGVIHEGSTTASMIVLMGMAVGVDYSLFYLKREREERNRGASNEEALHRAAATSGRAVLVSGLTVMTAAGGLMLSGSSVFTSLGLGTFLVVLVAVIGSLTVLPALLSKLGDRVMFWRLPFVRSERESRIWRTALRPALRHPKITAVGAVALLLAVASPMLHMHTRNDGVKDAPQSLAIAKTYTQITEAFGTADAPAEVVVHAVNIHAPSMHSAIAALRKAVGKPVPMSRFANNTIQLDVPLAGDGDNAASAKALQRLRSQILPATIGALPGVSWAVTGETAGNADFTTTIDDHMALIFGFVGLLTIALMLLCFRSLTVALTAIALNSLSVGAAYGAMVWAFQDGHMQGPLGFHPTGTIAPWVPLFLFAVLFGLSMDYHVFIVSRIRELVDRGHSTKEAVDRGIRSTASTVTSAAAVMVGVFSVFATLGLLSMKEMGFGLAVSVLIDATIIRALLLPAAMTLLGEHNWWLPRVFKRLPQLSRTQPAPPSTAPAHQ